MISIVIPVYNGEKFIEDTYRMLCESDERDFEILFMDDGSKDQSGEILKKLAEQDARVRYERKENGGIASARNYGLERAKGEYICFLDQDDFVKKDMFSLMLTDIKSTGADFVQAGTNRVINGVEESACTEAGITVIEKGQKAFDWYLQSLIMRGVAPHPECRANGSIWSCLFRTDFLRKNNITFYKYCDYEDDWIFCTLAYRAAAKICFEQKTVYSWRVHIQSESHKLTLKDRYLDHFYENYQSMYAFFLDTVKKTDLTKDEISRYEREMQKTGLLWALSNETGRGVTVHSTKESAALLKEVVKKEKKKGIQPGLGRHPLYISTYEMTGWKKTYRLLRDRLLVFLLLHHGITAAVVLNRKVFHGRWHI